MCHGWKPGEEMAMQVSGVGRGNVDKGDRKIAGKMGKGSCCWCGEAALEQGRDGGNMTEEGRKRWWRR